MCGIETSVLQIDWTTIGIKLSMSYISIILT